jgi:hypothetical protein
MKTQKDVKDSVQSGIRHTLSEGKREQTQNCKAFPKMSNEQRVSLQKRKVGR